MDNETEQARIIDELREQLRRVKRQRDLVAKQRDLEIARGNRLSEDIRYTSLATLRAERDEAIAALARKDWPPGWRMRVGYLYAPGGTEFQWRWTAAGRWRPGGCDVSDGSGINTHEQALAKAWAEYDATHNQGATP